MRVVPIRSGVRGRAGRSSRPGCTGRTEEAVAIVKELVAARQWGTSALIGTRLRTLGELMGRPMAKSTLRSPSPN